MLMKMPDEDSRIAAAGVAAVRHYVPGGRENGGGIGRLVGYIADTAKVSGEEHIVTDTRGAWWSPVKSPARLLWSILTMAGDRLLAPMRIHHIHVAGRGSTSRKLVLTNAARLFGCVHILHLHDYDYAADFSMRSPRLQRLIRRMFQRANRVIVLGQRDRVTLSTLLGVDESRIVVARNCVPDPGVSCGQRDTIPLIVFLGRLSERKGVPELLLALSHLTMKNIAWKAVIAGDGPVDDYRNKIISLGLADRVEMPGWLAESETRALCASASILVLPSHAEGMAMAVVEGLAHGLAVVTTRVGAHEEVITDGETGVFVPVGNVDALAAALAGLLANPATMVHISARGRAHYLNYFSMKAYMRALNELYEAILTLPQDAGGRS